MEVIYSFQAFVAQWSPRLVLAILALLRAQTIEELIFDVDVPWASGSGVQVLVPPASCSQSHGN
ncbi:hypothetical protein ACFLY4_10105, partial [Chloroflexota bacterium]